MKLLVCMCAFFAVANAAFLGLLKGGNGGVGSNVQVYGGHSHYSHSHGYVHSSPPKVIKVKIINEHVPAVIPAPASAVKVIKVIHQESRGFGGHGPLVAGQAPEVIRFIHENAGSNSGSFIGGPAKVIRVIHEQANAPIALAGSASAVVPQSSFLPPVQAPAAAFTVPAAQYGAPASIYIPPAPQYRAEATSQIQFTAPEPVPIATHVPAQSYGPPNK